MLFLCQYHTAYSQSLAGNKSTYFQARLISPDYRALALSPATTGSKCNSKRKVHPPRRGFTTWRDLFILSYLGGRNFNQRLRGFPLQTAGGPQMVTAVFRKSRSPHKQSFSGKSSPAILRRIESRKLFCHFGGPRSGVYGGAYLGHRTRRIPGIP